MKKELKMIKKNPQEIKSGEIDESALKKEMGRRFKCFRKVIGKSQLQLSNELKTTPGVVRGIEKCEIFPDQKIIKSSYELYGLDLNWFFLGGSGDNTMFLREKKIAIVLKSVFKLLAEDRNYSPEKYDAFMKLLKKPELAEHLFCKLKNLKIP